MQKRMLIIEDEYRLADMLKDWFEHKNFLCTVCTDGSEGYVEAIHQEYQIILLDVNLPGMDGFTVLKEMRKNRIHSLVLMLTARVELEDKLQGFHEGADDYLTKPFEIEELDARVNALLSRTAIEDADQIKAAGMILDKNRRTLGNTETDTAVKLSGKEFTLAEYFMENAGILLSKSQITEKIWGDESELGYNNEEVYISFLRRKMKFIGVSSSIITIRSEGYVLRSDHDQ